jgi:PAS domain S-box-containing protein
MAATRDLETLLQRMLEVVPAGIVHVGSDGSIRRANARAQAFLGLGFDELTRCYTVDFAGATTFEDGSPCPVEEYPVTRCLMTGEPQGPTTIGVEQPQGGVRWAMFTAMPVQQDDGRGAVVTLVDITERMAAEQERLSMERRLQQSDRLATVGTLAAGVAHEVNNPLTYIIGNLELAMLAVEDDLPLRGLLQDALSGAERVRRIVSDLGRFSRISSERRSIPLARALASAAAMASTELRHRAHLIGDLDHLPPVLAPEGEMVQVFLNLLINAAHAIPEGRAEAQAITVSGSVRDREVVIDVHDTGPGMSDEVRRRAFEPFYSTKEPGRGTGLGLAICRNLIHQMGGHIELPTVHHGTTVRIVLPVAPTTASTATDTTRSPTPAPTQRRLRVLVVDDEPAITRLVASLLSHHDVNTARSGRQALALLDTGAWDLVLCDLTMPDGTGTEVYEAVEARDPALARRMVFMTGGAFTEQTRQFVEHTDRPVLYKPFGAAELRGVIARAARDSG